MADDERVETESMPLTEPYKPAFDTGIHQEPSPNSSSRSRRRVAGDGGTEGRTPQPDRAGRRLIPAAYTRRTAVRGDSGRLRCPTGTMYLKWWKFS